MPGDLETRVTVLEVRAESMQQAMGEMKDQLKAMSADLSSIGTKLDVREERMVLMQNEMNKLSYQLGQLMEATSKNAPGWKTYIVLGMLAAGGASALQLAKAAFGF